MELTRRDAVAGLATLGAGVGSGCLDRPLGERRQSAESPVDHPGSTESDQRGLMPEGDDG